MRGMAGIAVTSAALLLIPCCGEPQKDPLKTTPVLVGSPAPLVATVIPGTVSLPQSLPTALPTAILEVLNTKRTPLTGAVTLAGGSISTYALMANGEVIGWGNSGEFFGDGKTDVHSVATRVLGAELGVKAISTRASYTCVLTKAGRVKCWGWNGNGVGKGGSPNSRAPLDVPGLESNVAFISSLGAFKSCAVTIEGRVKCWGLPSMDVTSIAGLENIVAVTSRCALDTTGRVKCWGRNDNGELGTGEGTTVQRSQPADVGGLGLGVKALSEGDWHSCALTSAGGVKCWGANEKGQLGDGTKTQRSTPVAVLGLSSGVKAIASDRENSCALTASDEVMCWGANSDGQLGDGSKTDRSVPVKVKGLDLKVSAISMGHSHACALIVGGAVRCWGDNSLMQLGDGTSDSRLGPGDVMSEL